jgi:hypothetical protein
MAYARPPFGQLPRLILFAFLLTAGCGGDEGGTVFGVGGTSGFIGDTRLQREVADLLSARTLSRDPTQRTATEAELYALRNADAGRTASASVLTPTPTMKTLFGRVGITAGRGSYVEEDLRLNAPLAQVAGGHAGHDYFAVDGKFLNILDEIANFYGKLHHGFNGQAPIDAIDQIVACHNLTLGARVACAYPYDSLSSAEKLSSDYVYESLIGVWVYHEFGHYYLLHLLDFLRGPLDPTGLVSYSSASEDDADFVAGALAAKAGLDPNWGVESYDLLVYYASQRLGRYSSYVEVLDDPMVQLQSVSASYSPNAVRKQNFLNGYDTYDER